MSMVVTGGAGYIGVTVSPVLIREGHTNQLLKSTPELCEIDKIMASVWDWHQQRFTNEVSNLSSHYEGNQ